MSIELTDLQLEKVQEYMVEVQTAISQLKEIGSLRSSTNTISPETINSHLSNSYNYYKVIVSEYERKKYEHEMRKTNFQIWWDEKFIEVRNKLNDGRTASKFASKSEIDSQTRVDNKEKFSELNDELIKSDYILATYRRIMMKFPDFENNLRTLSVNMRSEMKNLNLV